jgi:hypothetical protein
MGFGQCCRATSFYAAPAPVENFDAAPAPTVLYSKAKFLKGTKFQTHVDSFDSV